MDSPKRKTNSESSREFWKFVDRIYASKDCSRVKVDVGEPWIDSNRDLSPSLVIEDESNSK